MASISDSSVLSFHPKIVKSSETSSFSSASLNLFFIDSDNFCNIILKVIMIINKINKRIYNLKMLIQSYSSSSSFSSYSSFSSLFSSPSLFSSDFSPSSSSSSSASSEDLLFP